MTKKSHLRNPDAIMTKILEILQTASGHSTENEVFGHLGILNQYADVPKGTSAIGRIQHGWVPLEIGRLSYKNDLVKTLIWSGKSAYFIEEMGWKNFKIIGSPWIYLLEIMEQKGWSTKNPIQNRSINQLWVFGNHSVIGNEVGTQARLLEFLLNVRKCASHNSKVLLFYSDYFSLTPQIRNEFKDLDILTISNARLRTASADSYLFSLFYLLLNTKQIVLDAPSTIVLYAISLNCNVEFIQSSDLQKLIAISSTKGDVDLVTLLSGSASAKQLLEIANRELGQDFKLSPEEMRRLFFWENGLLNSLKRLRLILESLIALALHLKTLREALNVNRSIRKVFTRKPS